MSAFFVTAKTIANATACMAARGPIGNIDLPRDLWAMNARALFERYGDTLSEYEGAIDAYSSPSPSNDPYQVLKSANCLLYQCSEGDVDQMPLFQALERAIEAFAETLGGEEQARNHPRYEAAKWDIA
jgi:hypothetical protein